MKKAKKSAFDIRYISLKEASEISDYHPDYLSYLIRKGKIEGKRIGRDWLTTQEALRNYLLTKKFLPIKDILFSKLSPKKILFLGTAAVLIGIAVFLIFVPPPFLQKAPGDFTKKQLDKENIGGVEVTTFTSDESGEIEISVEPERALQKLEEKSLWQEAQNFFSNIF